MSVNEATLRRNLIRVAKQEPRGSRLQKIIAQLLYAEDFDPKEIAETEAGPHEGDADEPYMGGHFTQQDKHELGEKQEAGKLPKEETEPAKMPAKHQEKQAGLAKLSSTDRALFKDLVKLAHSDKTARGPILSMLVEAGLVSAGDVPEAFKKQWDKSKGKKEDKGKSDKKDKGKKAGEAQLLARFEKGDTEAFREWLNNQPQDVQDDWAQNKEKYKDKFKDKSASLFAKVVLKRSARNS